MRAFLVVLSFAAPVALVACGPTPAAPAPPSCSDAERNGGETDVDCGGGVCGVCGDELGCAAAGDCASGVCTAGSCRAATCADGVKNGAEADVDCAGTCGPCADGRICAAAADCASGVCTAGSCRAATCADGVKNGAEADVDCAGTCGPCADGRLCAAAADCTSGVCTAETCRAPSCDDTVRNGAESGVDCGGACGPCGPAATCANRDDCCPVGPRNVLRDPVPFVRSGTGDDAEGLAANQMRASSEYGHAQRLDFIADGLVAANGHPYWGTPSGVTAARLFFRMPAATALMGLCYKNGGSALVDTGDWLPKGVHLESWDGTQWVSAGDYQTAPNQNYQYFPVRAATASDLWRLRFEGIWTQNRYAVLEIELLAAP